MFKRPQICQRLLVEIQGINVTLPDPLIRFLERYRQERGLQTQSEVVERAVHLLREQVLKLEYRERKLTRERSTLVKVENDLGGPTRWPGISA
jgi:Arc/MetJ-type ribon-helix-helix transcriptional regulator